MSDKPLGLGVLGYGHFIRSNFIKHLARVDSIRLVGVYNRGEERRRQAAEDGYWVTGDLDEMLARDDVEAVLVGTANAIHRDHAVAAARAGKHILCEKPMALTLGDIDDMVRQAEQAGVITHVNHGGPYTVAFQKFHELVRAHCGRIMQVWIRNSRHFGTWKMGARHFAVANPDVSGGWTVHHSCHFLNMACVLIDSEANPARRVYHVTQKSSPQAPSEELITSVIHFGDGATVQISDGTSIGGFGDLGVIGTDADVRLLGERITLVRHGPPDPGQRPGNLSGVTETFDVPSSGKALEIVGAMFARAVRTGDTSRLLSFRWVAHEYRILQAMGRSAETGQVVDVE